MISTESPQAPIISTVLDAYLIGCNINVEHHKAKVDMEGQLLALLPPPVLSPPSDWKAWTAPKGDNIRDNWLPPEVLGQYRRNRNWVSKCVITNCDLRLLNTSKLSYPFRSGAMHPVKICMTQSQATCYGISLLEL
jgi:hypothetical protein